MLRVQSFRDPDRVFGILIVIDDANTVMSPAQSAFDLSLRAGIVVQISDHDRAWHRRHKMRECRVRGAIETYCDYRDSYRGLGVHGFLSPSLGAVGAALSLGTVLSKSFCSSNDIGILGISGGPVMVKGSTMVGVTITISSELVLLIERERNRFPRIGMSPNPGTLDICAVVLWSNSPAMPKL